MSANASDPKIVINGLAFHSKPIDPEEAFKVDHAKQREQMNLRHLQETLVEIHDVAFALGSSSEDPAVAASKIMMKAKRALAVTGWRPPEDAE